MDREDLRLAVYDSFARTGRAPTVDDLAGRFGVGADDLRAGVESLASERQLVFRDDEIVMAHPFSAVPLGFSVMGRETLWWGGCAWDAFSMPFLLDDDPEVLVATRCPACGKAHAWAVNRDKPPVGSQVAHFLTPVVHMWDDVVHTCAHQSIFCSTTCVDRWLNVNDKEHGYVLSLGTLWRLASRWYEGRLDRGYQRREPTDAAEYLASVGLGGEFWGFEE